MQSIKTENTEHVDDQREQGGLTCHKRGEAKGERSLFFLLRPPFGNHFVTFCGAFGHFFAYPISPPPFCGRVRRKTKEKNSGSEGWLCQG